jgi:GT2 family glycosyltransferase
MTLAVPPDDPGDPPTAHAPRPAVRRPRLPAVGPRLAVVVVNFCQWRNTARLVGQLRRSVAARTGTARIVVVDNHSPPSRRAAAVARRPGVTVLRSARNEGFARAVNRGAAAAGDADWLLLLNPDVTAADGFLDDALDAAAAADPNAGAVGFRLLDPDGGRQASCGPFPTLLRTVGGLLRRRAARKCRHLPGGRPVAWATGGCLLVRRACFDRLGGLDPAYFLYYEDVDFCRRAAADGWAVWYDPRVAVTHHRPLHARPVPAPLRLVTRHALLTYAGRHWPGWQAAALARLVRLEAGVRRTVARLRGDAVAAACYRHLGRLTGDLRSGDVPAAGRRVRFAARFLRPIAAAQDIPRTR